MNRPTSVTVFGILNIVFAGLGLLGTLGSIVMFFAPGDSKNPVIRLIHDSPGYAAFLKLSTALGLVVCAGLLASGIGLLKLKPWARTFSLFYGVYAIVMVVIGTVVNYFYLVQPMLAEAHGKSGPEAGAAIGGAIGAMFGGCFGMIYPILLLIFMQRASVKAAFGIVPSVPQT